MELQENRSEAHQTLNLDKERIMTALRNSPGGFNSARAASSGQKAEEDSTYRHRPAFSSQGGFDRQPSGGLPQMRGSESQQTFASSQPGIVTV